MSLNYYLESILGKKIVGVVTKERGGSPVYQVFIIFDDNTYFEFWGNDINNGKGLWRGGVEEVKNYMPDAKIKNEFYNENLKNKSYGGSIKNMSSEQAQIFLDYLNAEIEREDTYHTKLLIEDRREVAYGYKFSLERLRQTQDAFLRILNGQNPRG